MEPHRLFTIEEANALLPQIEDLVKLLQQKKKQQDKLHDALLFEELLQQSFTDGPLPSSIELSAQDVDESAEEFAECLKKIRAIGCIVRSLEPPAVIFPAERNGEKIFLSWMHGEETIRYYQAGHSAGAQRFPLPDSAGPQP